VDLSNRSLKAKARAVAWELIAELNRPPAGRVQGVASDPDLGTVRVTVTPPGDPAPRHVGLWMSPIETVITDKLGPHTMTRIDLARRCGLPYDPKFKTLVANLIDRGILRESEDENGVQNTSQDRRKSLPR
jgi:hypothetical protein